MISPMKSMFKPLLNKVFFFDIRCQILDVRIVMVKKATQSP
jgi:hypothetical protein